MPIEKVFAINATPKEIFAAIERDLDAASAYAGDVHDVLRRERDRLIEMRVTIGAIPCLLTYRLDERDGHTEITGALSPYGWKYGAFRIMTFGMRKQVFEIALVEALVNLKAAVEGDSGQPSSRQEGMESAQAE